MWTAEHRNASGTEIKKTFCSSCWSELVNEITEDSTPVLPGDQIIITKE